MKKKFKIPHPWGRNVPVLLLFTFILYSGYQLSNRCHIIEPRYLPLTWMDEGIPFCLWTVWPYFVLVLLAFLPMGIKDKDLFWRTMIAFTIAVGVNIFVWTFLPTVFHRPPQPEVDGANSYAYHWLCGIDTPANCFPSGHITSPVIGCWAFTKAYPKQRIFIWVLLALLSITIFTTKQHYVWDLPGGVCTAFIGIKLSDGLYSKFKPAKANEADTII